MHDGKDNNKYVIVCHNWFEKVDNWVDNGDRCDGEPSVSLFLIQFGIGVFQLFQHIEVGESDDTAQNK